MNSIPRYTFYDVPFWLSSDRSLPLGGYFPRKLIYMLNTSNFNEKQKAEYEYFQRTPPPADAHPWDLYCCYNNYGQDCPCTEDSVHAVYDRYFLSPEQNEISSELELHQGLRNIIQAHFRRDTPYTDEAKQLFIDVMYASIIKYKDSSQSIYLPAFIQSKCNCRYDESELVLECMNRENWFSHGSGARCSWMDDEGYKQLKLWIPDHIDRDRREDEVLEYITTHDVKNCVYDSDSDSDSD